MKRFNFSTREIDLHMASLKEWHVFVRRREAEMIFSLFPQTRFSFSLEIGAGDGGQSEIISKYCDRLICTEIDANSHKWFGSNILERNLKNVEFLLCDCQDLSQFSDECFDLIFSSNVLEHVQDLNLCLSECARVLKDDGVMLHTMPSRLWKILNVVLAPLKFRLPRVHGLSSGHFDEFRDFGRTVWVQKIEKCGFHIDGVYALPFYVGHGNSFSRLIKMGNRIGLAASFLYIAHKNQKESLG